MEFYASWASAVGAGTVQHVWVQREQVQWGGCNAGSCNGRLRKVRGLDAVAVDKRQQQSDGGCGSYGDC